jgi:hypothetical protein
LHLPDADDPGHGEAPVAAVADDLRVRSEAIAALKGADGA